MYGSLVVLFHYVGTLSNYQCMRGYLVAPTKVYGEACVHYGCWSIDMLVPSLFWGLQNISLWRLVCEGTICMFVMSRTNLCIWGSTNCKVTSWYTISFWALCDHRWYYNKILLKLGIYNLMMATGKG